MDYKNELEYRIKNRKKRSLLDVNTKLQHFSLISYAVPFERIKEFIPAPFELWTFTDNEKKFALISAVPFVDSDFNFYELQNSQNSNFVKPISEPI